MEVMKVQWTFPSEFDSTQQPTGPNFFFKETFPVGFGGQLEAWLSKVAAMVPAAVSKELVMVAVGFGGQEPAGLAN